MLRCRLAVLVGWFLFCRCLLQPHGLNRSRPLAILIAMATARSGNRSNRSKFASIFTAPNDERGYDNAHYIGHDEPGIGFDSTAPRSGNNVQWEFTLPRERLLLATQSFENLIAFWVSMALCDPPILPERRVHPGQRSEHSQHCGVGAPRAAILSSRLSSLHFSNQPRSDLFMRRAYY